MGGTLRRVFLVANLKDYLYRSALYSHTVPPVPPMTYFKGNRPTFGDFIVVFVFHILTQSYLLLFIIYINFSILNIVNSSVCWLITISVIKMTKLKEKITSHLRSPVSLLSLFTNQCEQMCDGAFSLVIRGLHFVQQSLGICNPPVYRHEKYRVSLNLWVWVWVGLWQTRLPSRLDEVVR